MTSARESSFPLGASLALEQLEDDPHPLLAQLRLHEPVSWIGALGGWLITRYDIAMEVLRDARRFTVDDPRFSTSVVVGPSMLSLDGERHERHRSPFCAPFRPVEVRERFAAFVEQEAERLIASLEPTGGAELRRSFAGPLAAATVAWALGIGRDEVAQLLGWYDEIVGGVSAITAGRDLPETAARAFENLSVRLRDAIGDHSSLLASATAGGQLNVSEVVSNAAVLLFGGIETTEGMIANALLALLERPQEMMRVREQPELLDRAVEESLRLEPAAAVLDRYATVDTRVAEVKIAAHELVRVSLTAANRDPALFVEPDCFDLERSNARRHLAFAQGPHVCLGVHLARLEARTALRTALVQLERLRLDPEHQPRVTGLVFRKPRELHVRWD